jgi:hypothetical protein
MQPATRDTLLAALSYTEWRSVDELVALTGITGATVRRALYALLVSFPDDTVGAVSREMQARPGYKKRMWCFRRNMKNEKPPLRNAPAFGILRETPGPGAHQKG